MESNCGANALGVPQQFLQVRPGLWCSSDSQNVNSSGINFLDERLGVWEEVDMAVKVYHIAPTDLRKAPSSTMPRSSTSRNGFVSPSCVEDRPPPTHLSNPWVFTWCTA